MFVHVAMTNVCWCKYRAKGSEAQRFLLWKCRCTTTRGKFLRSKNAALNPKKKHHRTSGVYSKKKQKGLVASRQLALQWEHKQWVSQKSLIDFAVQMQSNQTHGVREPNVTSIKPHANVQTRCVAVRLFESHHGSSAFIVESNFQ
jgi:hypothetical protein